MGYDKTSQIHGLRKERVIKTYKMKKSCKHASLAFYDSSGKKEHIQKAIKMFLLTLLGWSKSISLNEARAKFFMETGS